MNCFKERRLSEKNEKGNKSFPLKGPSYRRWFHQLQWGIFEEMFPIVGVFDFLFPFGGIIASNILDHVLIWTGLGFQTCLWWQKVQWNDVFFYHVVHSAVNFTNRQVQWSIYRDFFSDAWNTSSIINLNWNEQRGVGHKCNGNRTSFG